MSGQNERPDTLEDRKEAEQQLCSCFLNLFEALPPELRPKPISSMVGLRKVVCPGCGFKYWTNRDTDFCVDCVKKGLDKQGEKTPESDSPNGA